jgi:hypothetical protein
MSQNTQLVTMLSKYTKRISLALALPKSCAQVGQGGRLIVGQQSVSDSKELEICNRVKINAISEQQSNELTLPPSFKNFCATSPSCSSQ